MSAIITYALAQVAITYVAHIISLGIGMNLYLVALTEDVKRHLDVMNECIKTEKAKRSDISKQYAEYIQFHSDTKQLRITIQILERAMGQCRNLNFSPFFQHDGLF